MAKQKNKISEEDKIILEVYTMGWNDCCSGDNTNCLAFKDSILLTRAYKIGWLDYLCGDDVSSLDYQTDEEILNNIKNEDDKKEQ